MKYCMNTPRFAHETLDDETIIIDFDLGTYYSLSGTAHWIWFLIEKKHSVVEVVSQITAHYAGEQEEIEAAVRQFIGQLAQAEIIVKGEPSLSTITSLPLTHRELFATPILEEHTDIQDLLLLDPIHEVGKHGWPMRNS